MKNSNDFVQMPMAYTWITNNAIFISQPNFWFNGSTGCSQNIQGPQGPSSISSCEDEVPIEDNKGHNCKACKEFYPYARSNQDDGTLICYACRNNL